MVVVRLSCIFCLVNSNCVNSFKCYFDVSHVCRTAIRYLPIPAINCFRNFNIRSCVVSWTVIVNDSWAVLPVKSSALQVTIVSPIGNRAYWLDPESSLMQPSFALCMFADFSTLYCNRWHVPWHLRVKFFLIIIFFLLLLVVVIPSSLVYPL